MNSVKYVAGGVAVLALIAGFSWLYFQDLLAQLGGIL